MGIETIKTIKIKIENAKYSIYSEFADMFLDDKITWEEYIQVIRGVNCAIDEAHKQLSKIMGE